MNVSIQDPSPATAASSEKGGLLALLHSLAQDGKAWPPVLLAGVLWRALTHIGAHLEVMRLLRLPALAGAAARNPRFVFKYLTHDYLARGLTTRERAACFLHHYRRLHATHPERLLRRTLEGDVTLYETSGAGTRFSISLGLSRPWDKEGELSLNLHVDGEIMFVVSFTIVPGYVVRSTAAETLLVTRIQGMKGCYRLISHATKTLHNVSPDALLIAALQGLAARLGIAEMAGVSAVRQCSYLPNYAALFTRSYDTFFTELGAVKNSAGFFIAPLPLVEKPLAFIKQGHKLRTREKRAFKSEVAATMGYSFQALLTIPNFTFVPDPDTDSSPQLIAVHSSD